MESAERHRITQRVTLTGAAVNCVLASLQIVFGLLGKSQALLADGIHTLSDLSTDFIVLYASKRSSKAADTDHPYGHGRIETLASMLLGAILGMVGIGIGIRGVETIFNPQAFNPEAITIVFAGIAIVAKEGLYRYTLRAARATHSSLLESNAWHHRSDALSSIVVVIGISAQVMGVPYMDAVAAIIVACMISWMGLRLGRKALDELIDTGLDLDLIEQVRGAMQASAHRGRPGFNRIRGALHRTSHRVPGQETVPQDHRRADSHRPPGRYHQGVCARQTPRTKANRARSATGLERYQRK